MSLPLDPEHSGWPLCAERGEPYGVQLSEHAFLIFAPCDKEHHPVSPSFCRACADERAKK